MISRATPLFANPTTNRSSKKSMSSQVRGNQCQYSFHDGTILTLPHNRKAYFISRIGIETRGLRISAAQLGESGEEAHIPACYEPLAGFRQVLLALSSNII
jgi:hypothetical protein